jgi:cytochrome c6
MGVVAAVIMGLWLGLGVGSGAIAPDPSLLLPNPLPNGAALFEVHCIGCHINGGNIVRRGKNLRQQTLERNGYGTVEAIAQLITQGKGNMSAYADRMTAPEIEAVAVYVRDQAEQGWKS